MTGHGMGKVMAQYWRDVSAAPPLDAAARAQVLGALQQHGQRCTAEEAEQLGQLAVTAAEVRAALATASPGRSPGPDGIPVELYQHYEAEFAPVLAEVFTAVGEGIGVPDGLLDGVWAFFYKGGDASEPSNYRPITLTDTDYRTLARVLCRRLQPVFGRVIDPEQTAFLTERRIADNVLLLQLTPGLLKAAGQSPGVAAFLDFYKTGHSSSPASSALAWGRVHVMGVALAD